MWEKSQVSTQIVSGALRPINRDGDLSIGWYPLLVKLKTFGGVFQHCWIYLDLGVVVAVRNKKRKRWINEQGEDVDGYDDGVKEEEEEKGGKQEEKEEEKEGRGGSRGEGRGVEENREKE